LLQFANSAAAYELLFANSGVALAKYAKVATLLLPTLIRSFSDFTFTNIKLVCSFHIYAEYFAIQLIDRLCTLFSTAGLSALSSDCKVFGLLPPMYDFNPWNVKGARDEGRAKYAERYRISHRYLSFDTPLLCF